MRSVLLLLAVGCAVPEDVTEVVQAINCPNFMCGSNSPEIDHMGMHDGNVNGLANANGFRLAKVTHDDKPYRMKVVGAEIVLDNGDEVLRGENVKGAIMLFVHEPSHTEYNVRISQVLKTTMWAVKYRMAPTTAPTYLLEWTAADQPPAGAEWKNICTAPLAENDGDMDQFHAIVFEGDRIDPATKVVTGFDPTWFNIGCAGHALAKLHLTGHTEAAQVANAFTTTISERTTMLKMLSADYCGSGKNFTVAGVHLEWQDDKQWMKLPSATLPIEARWTPHGAACLNTPRVVANPTALSDATFPFTSEIQFRYQIQHACGHPIPKCLTTVASYHLISANP